MQTVFRLFCGLGKLMETVFSHVARGGIGGFSQFPAFISEKTEYIIYSVIFWKSTMEESPLC
jgi:hypothetical protein